MDVIYELETDKTPDEAIESVKDALKARSYGVLWELNLAGKIREKGLDFEHNFHIMEVCNPGKAREVLNQHLDMGYFLPCKVGVYTRDGRTRIGMLRPESLMALAGHEELQAVAGQVEAEIREALLEAVEHPTAESI